jgi:hypothetical protein
MCGKPFWVMEWGGCEEKNGVLVCGGDSSTKIRELSPPMLGPSQIKLGLILQSGGNLG